MTNEFDLFKFITGINNLSYKKDKWWIKTALYDTELLNEMMVVDWSEVSSFRGFSGDGRLSSKFIRSHEKMLDWTEIFKFQHNVPKPLILAHVDEIDWPDVVSYNYFRFCIYNFNDKIVREMLKHLDNIKCFYYINSNFLEFEYNDDDGIKRFAEHFNQKTQALIYNKYHSLLI